MEIAIVVLTSVLVSVTAYYAWQTRRTVEELRRARGASILPRITLSLQHPGPTVAFILLANNGSGVAINVDVVISYEPDGPTVPWTAPVMTVGETQSLLPPGDSLNMQNLVEFARISVQGSCKDALGDRHEIDEELNPREYWDVRAASQTEWRQQPVDEMNRNLESIRKAVEKIANWHR